MILQHFFVCSEEVSEERRGVERASVHHEDKKPRNGKNLQEREKEERSRPRLFTLRIKTLADGPRIT